MVSGPNTHGSLEKFLKDQDVRLTLVERRMAVSGGGGAGPTDTGWVDLTPYVTMSSGWSFVSDGTTFGGLKARRVGNLVQMHIANVRAAAGTFTIPVGGNISNSTIFTNLPEQFRPQTGTFGTLATGTAGPTASIHITPAGGAALAAMAAPADLTATTANVQTDFSAGGVYVVEGSFGAVGTATSGGGAPYDAEPGLIVATGRSVLPSGWLLCDGSVYSPTAYPELYGAIGTMYGGTAAAPLLPNLKGRVLVGLDSAQTEFDTLGETGGAKTHTLTEAQIPAHTHGIRRSGEEVGNYGLAVGGGFADRVSCPASLRVRRPSA